ncbi:MAG: SH3 domain-containing protein [Synergistaceae bacterium]|nr:SH3 domain-containing protein [Synergistaceae bacterium]
MSWVILALTLGASITSIIHGVFMLFGSLSVNAGLLLDIPKTIYACLPVVSALFALVGGIIAFNKSKWGALFLLAATGLCVPSRDSWPYGGIYFFTMLLCFFLKPEPHDEYDDLFYEEDEQETENIEPRRQTPGYYLGNESENYDEEQESVDYLQGGFPDIPKPNLNEVISTPLVDADIASPIINNEPPKLRRRMSKTCPTCGATVAREARFCSTCGTALLVPAEDLLENQNNDPQVNVNAIKVNEATPGKLESDFAAHRIEAERQKSTNFMNEVPVNEAEINFAVNDINSISNDGDDMAQANKVFVKPRRETIDYQGSERRSRSNNNIDAAASSYQEFSRYTRRNKKRKRSAGRKILSMLVLVAAVGGALYFLLGLRKLPPGDLPPMARDQVVDATTKQNNNSPVPAVSTSTNLPPISVQENQEIAVPGQTITENILPNFVPEREPKSGVVVGSNVNVRADHSTSSNRVARLNVNSKIEIIGTFNVTSGQYQGIWYNVITGGKEGWIYGRYVQPTGSGLPSGYSNALLKTFGSNRSQLVESLGQPTRSSNTSAEWSGLTATLKGEDITRIRITNANRELQNGLKVGMSQTALLQILGYPSGVSNKILQYNEGSKTGVSVQLDKNNAISSITVNAIQ